MSNPTYQNINYVNITSNSKYISKNNQIDTTGKIDEKFLKNKYNYIVDEILETTPEEPTIESPDIIFVLSGEYYDLKQKIEITNTTTYSYIQMDVPISSTVFVKDIDCLFILKDKISNNQIWVQYNNGFDNTQTLELKNTTKSLITSGPVDVNNQITIGKFQEPELSTRKQLNISDEIITKTFKDNYCYLLTAKIYDDSIYYNDIDLIKYNITDNNYEALLHLTLPFGYILTEGFLYIDDNTGEIYLYKKLQMMIEANEVIYQFSKIIYNLTEYSEIILCSSNNVNSPISNTMTSIIDMVYNNNILYVILIKKVNNVETRSLFVCDLINNNIYDTYTYEGVNVLNNIYKIININNDIYVLTYNNTKHIILKYDTSETNNFSVYYTVNNTYTTKDPDYTFRADDKYIYNITSTLIEIYSFINKSKLLEITNTYTSSNIYDIIYDNIFIYILYTINENSNVISYLDYYKNNTLNQHLLINNELQNIFTENIININNLNYIIDTRLINTDNKLKTVDIQTTSPYYYLFLYSDLINYIDINKNNTTFYNFLNIQTQKLNNIINKDEILLTKEGIVAPTINAVDINAIDTLSVSNTRYNIIKNIPSIITQTFYFNFNNGLIYYFDTIQYPTIYNCLNIYNIENNTTEYSINIDNILQFEFDRENIFSDFDSNGNLYIFVRNSTHAEIVKIYKNDDSFTYSLLLQDQTSIVEDLIQREIKNIRIYNDILYLICWDTPTLCALNLSSLNYYHYTINNNSYIITDIYIDNNNLYLNVSDSETYYILQQDLTITGTVSGNIIYTGGLYNNVRLIDSNIFMEEHIEENYILHILNLYTLIETNKITSENWINIEENIFYDNKSFFICNEHSNTMYNINNEIIELEYNIYKIFKYKTLLYGFIKEISSSYLYKCDCVLLIKSSIFYVNKDNSIFNNTVDFNNTVNFNNTINFNQDITTYGNIIVSTNSTDNNKLSIIQNNNHLNLGYNTSPYISTEYDNLYIMQGDLTTFTSATSGIKLNNSCNEIKGNTQLLNNYWLYFKNNNNGIRVNTSSNIDYFQIYSTNQIEIANDTNFNTATTGIRLNQSGITVKGATTFNSSVSLSSGTITTAATSNNDILNKKFYDDNRVGQKDTSGEIFNAYSGTNKNIASGAYSHAEGYATKATGNGGCHAEGAQTEAKGYISHAGGQGTIADQNAMTSIGKYNVKGDGINTLVNKNKLFVVGNGTSDTVRNDALVVKDDNTCYIQGDLTCKNINCQNINETVVSSIGISSTNIHSPGNLIKNIIYHDNYLFYYNYNSSNSVHNFNYLNLTDNTSTVIYNGNDYNNILTSSYKYIYTQSYIFWLTNENNETKIKCSYNTTTQTFTLNRNILSNIKYIDYNRMNSEDQYMILFYDPNESSNKKIKMFFVHITFTGNRIPNNYSYVICDIIPNTTFDYTNYLNWNYKCYRTSGVHLTIVIYLIATGSGGISINASQCVVITVNYRKSNGDYTDFTEYDGSVQYNLSGGLLYGVININKANYNLLYLYNNTIYHYKYDATHLYNLYNVNNLSDLNYYNFDEVTTCDTSLTLYRNTSNKIISYFYQTKLADISPSSNYIEQQLQFMSTNKYIFYKCYNYSSTEDKLEHMILIANYNNTNTFNSITTFNNAVNFNNTINSNISLLNSSNHLNLGFNTSPYVSTDYANLYIMQGNLTTYASATSGIKLSSSGNEIKGNHLTITNSSSTTINSNTINLTGGSSGDINISLHDEDGMRLFPVILLSHTDTTNQIYIKLYGRTAFYDKVYFGGGRQDSIPSLLNKSSIKNDIQSLISCCDNTQFIYSLKLSNDNKYIIYKYDKYNTETFKEISTSDYPIINNIYIFNTYLLFITLSGIYYIDITTEDLEIVELLADSNVNKIVIDPRENKNVFYVLYNSYDYFSKYIINDNNEFIKSDYHVFTSNNGYHNEDLNIIDMKFYENSIYFIHDLYEDNTNYYIVFSNYNENNNTIIRYQENNVILNNDNALINVYCYDNFVYFLITNNNSEIRFIKIKDDDINNYNIYNNIVNDNITKYNQNIYYQYNSEYFYLVSNNYIYYYSASDNLINLENKLYAIECKYITNEQDIYITNNGGIYNIGEDSGVEINGKILLNGSIQTSTINAAQLNISDIDVNVNKTILHNTLIDGDISNYQIGQPIFICGNKTYTLQRKTSNNKYPVYEYTEITDNNYTNNTLNQIPKITYENNGKFIGVITAIYPANTPLKINEITSNYIKIDNNTVDFATHGDYIFKVDDNTAIHQTTSGGSKVYEVGDEILYDGKIIDPEQPLLRKYENMIVGKITCIPNNTNYVSVFKS